MDEARVGQKGRTGFRWWIKGERPRGVCDRRFDGAYIFGAVRPATGEDFALVLPAVSTAAMSTFLAEFARTIPADSHAVVVLDQAGWHGSRDLAVPDNITLMALPPRSPELNPVENVWQFMRDNWLSNRIFQSYEAIVDHCCDAWNRLADQPWRIMSIGLRDWVHGF